MRFFLSKFTRIALAISVSTSATAAQPVSNSDIEFMLKAKKGMLEVKRDIESNQQQEQKKLPQTDKPKWVSANRYISDAQMLTQKSTAIKNKVLTSQQPQITGSSQGMPVTPNSDEEVILFASFGVPEYTLKSMLKAAVQSDIPTRIVFRGLKDKDGSLKEASLAIQKLIASAKLDKQPKVQIDPRLFNQYSVQYAPTMVYRGNGKTVSGSGLESIETFVQEARETKQSGSLGSFSDVYPIKERDILEVIQERLAKIDWEAKKRDAIGRFFKRQQMPLTELNQDDDIRYAIDPRVRFTRDQTDNRGNIYAKAGEIVDPTQSMPFTTTMYVVDGRSERQLRWLEATLDPTQSGMQYILLSALPSSKDFEEFGRLQKRFGRRLYLLQADMLKKFQMEHVPAKVEILKGQIRITEIGARTLSNANYQPVNIGG